MSKPFTEEQRQAWSAVHGEVLALSEFMERYVPGVSEAIRHSQEPRHPFGRHLSGLKEARNDLLEMVSDLSGAELRELDLQLRQKLGLVLDTLQGKRLAKISAIRERGSISTDNQFRLVYGRVEQIWGDSAHLKKFEELQALLASYEAKSAGKNSRTLKA